MPAFLQNLLSTEHLTNGAIYLLTALFGAAVWALKGWFENRERYQVHLSWETEYHGPQGYDSVPVLYIQSLSKNPINITRLNFLDGFRRRSSVYPFASDDPEFHPLPFKIPPGERRSIYLDSSVAWAVAETTPVWIGFVRLPRVYIRLETMGGNVRTFGGELCIPAKHRLR